MSEDIEINKNDIEAVEREVLAKQKLREDSMKMEIEAKIKRQMEEERKNNERENELIKLREEKTLMEKMLREKEVERQEEITKLKEQMGQTKAIHTSPSIASQPKFNPSNLNNDDLKEINEESLNAFLGKHGLTKSQWRGR